MWKRLLQVSFAIILISSVFLNSGERVHGAEVKEDFVCVQYILSHDDDPPACNRRCSTSCTDQGLRCAYGSTSNCIYLKDIVTNLSGINFFGVNFGPADQAIPRFLRLFLMIMFSLLGVFSIAYGFMGAYVRSQALDSAEKAEESMKIFKNALAGIITAFGGIVVAQVLALLFGIEGDIFSLHLIPKQGLEVDITIDDINNGICLPEQTGYYEVGSVDTEYICDANGKWQQK